MKLLDLFEKLSYFPSKLLNLNLGCLVKNVAADLIVFDPNYEDTINPKNFYSKSRNSTFENEKVRGKVLATLVDGRILFQKNLNID